MPTTNDTYTTTCFAGTQENTISTGVASFENEGIVNPTPIKLVNHTFTCDNGYYYRKKPEYTITALDPSRYYVTDNILATEPSNGKITKIEFDIFHRFTNAN